MVPGAFRLWVAPILTLALGASITCAQSSTEFIGFLGGAVFATAPPDDPSRLFVINQGSSGTAEIRVFDKNTKTSLGTFLTLTGLHTGSESGLLGLAFHPDYANNGYFYVYTSVPGGSQHHRMDVPAFKLNGRTY